MRRTLVAFSALMFCAALTGLRERPPDSRPHDARFGAFGKPVVAGELAGVSAVLEALVLGAPE
jgi:hypothetical protein